MLKNNVIWPPSRRFKSRTEWEPIGFFSEALCNATQFDIKLGFFSSSAINVLADGFAAFLYGGGRMRMVINDILSCEDKHALQVSESDKYLSYFDLDDLKSINYTLTIRDRHFFECISWLIRNKRIEIKVVKPKTGVGIAHSKCGIFSDGLNRVAFDGSCNFSRTALIANIESITAFCDWDGQGDLYKVDDIAADFERTFSGHDTSVEYLDSSKIRTNIISEFESKDISELLYDEVKIIDSTLDVSDSLSINIRAILSKAKTRVKTILDSQSQIANSNNSKNKPCFPFKEPREYQKQAFENWKKNNQKGLFAMATGTGKTLTSLNCLLNIYNKSGYYKALILVPTITLVEQWELECRRFHFGNIIKVCSHNSKWKSEIEDLKLREDLAQGEEPSYIIIATYASFARDTAFHTLVDFKKKTYRQLLLIADEAHNMGAKRILNRLEGIKFLRRIGLSATPERQFDEAANCELMKFFGCEGKHYTFEYSMKDAIDNGFLCRYKYFPHIIKLTDSEMKEYMHISLQLVKFYNIDKNCFSNPKDDVLMRLLLKRKRIVHKAKNKEEAFKEIIDNRYKERGNLKYTIVYVPEGSRPDNNNADIYDDRESIDGDDFSDNLIDGYTKIVQNVSKSTTVRKFVSGIKERDALLEQFAKGEVEVLTSMKCLDEGVDIPRSELAIFCASTGNPRQFIQRRGRILRTHPEKHMAEIHDLIVAPVVGFVEETYNMERNLLRTELERVRDFAILSENADNSYSVLEEITNYYNLSMF